jgi:hypothetical protein
MFKVTMRVKIMYHENLKEGSLSECSVTASPRPPDSRVLPSRSLSCSCRHSREIDLNCRQPASSRGYLLVLRVRVLETKLPRVLDWHGRMREPASHRRTLEERRILGVCTPGIARLYCLVRPTFCPGIFLETWKGDCSCSLPRHSSAERA